MSLRAKGIGIMDFTDAALLIAAVFAVTELYKRIYPASPPVITQAAVFVLGIAMSFLVAYSSYANTVKVGGLTLDKVNGPALLLIGILIGGGATLAHKGLQAVSNVGENQNPQ